jgi:NADPH:quinone reductase-like Zn-dependent oxidoreductase
VVVLGAAGKMGPSLAVLLRRAGVGRVIGVSRFSDAGSRQFLEEAGVETVVVCTMPPLAALPFRRPQLRLFT